MVGGQNVNKVSSASSAPALRRARLVLLPELSVKLERLLCLRDSRITDEGVLIIKAQQYRSQDQNRGDAWLRLQELVPRDLRREAAARAACSTKPTYGSKQRRLEGKSVRSAIKARARWFTNGGLRPAAMQGFPIGPAWNPATDATFDTGILVLDADRVGLRLVHGRGLSFSRPRASRARARRARRASGHPHHRAPIRGPCAQLPTTAFDILPRRLPQLRQHPA